MTRIGLIWAQAHGGVIGAAGGMPWHVPEDLARFRALTTGGPVVMGRRTWESFPDRFRPLPDRRNIVVTRDDEWSAPGAARAASLDAALALARAVLLSHSAVSDDGTRQRNGNVPDTIWVIGGGQLFLEAIDVADVLEVTELDLEVEGDTTAPGTDGWHVVASDPDAGWHTSRTGIRYRFLTYERPGGSGSLLDRTLPDAADHPASQGDDDDGDGQQRDH